MPESVVINDVPDNVIVYGNPAKNKKCVNPVLIIAEAGVNHNGNIETAKKLIDAAADAKAGYVKFQTFKANNLVTKSAAKAEYQKKNISNNESQLEMLKEA